ncbi:Serine incorporator/TMS membrane protein - like 1 [Theobroma cacao]|nr:Serine incorporator/TMS membrane protein - like 1 [Theobroma cacao]
MSGSAAAVEASVLHISSSNSQLVQRVKASMEPTNVDCSAERKKSLRARYFYGLIFFIINLTAWFIRDYGQSIEKLVESVEVIVFTQWEFSVTRKLFETCSKWHSGWWALKIFLLLQLISVIEFIGWWNNNWAPDEQRKQSCFFALFTSTVFYVASICGIVSMYYFYAPRPACSLNIFFITWTSILLIVMMAMSLHSKVNRGLLSSGIMASYVVFLCWSAIRSEPADEKCKLEKPKDGHGDWTAILGFLIAIGAIVMATFSTGIDSKSFQFRKDEVKLEDDIRYNYGFFHMIFSLGAMYFAMLFISWNLENSARKWSIDVGWTSTWVKIINEWFAATIYMWKLIAPVVKQPRVINHEESVQQINDSTLP